MKSIDTIEPTKHIKALVIAPPGNGKTAFAGTFPGVVFVDTDHGLKVLQSRWFKSWFPKADILGYESFDDKRNEYGLFTKATGFMDAMKFINSAMKTPGIKTLAFDSLSSLQVLGMNLAFELSKRDGKSKSLDKARMEGGLPFALPTQADFGSEMAVFAQLMDQALDLPVNVLFLAHERAEVNDSGGVVKREALLTGQAIRARVGKWFDEVWYLDVAPDGRRFLRTENDGSYNGLKSRALQVPNKLVNPTYPTIMEAVNELKP